MRHEALNGDSPVAACTIVAKNYLALGRVIARSFIDRHPGIPFYVLLADKADGYVDPNREPYRMTEAEQLGHPEVYPLAFRYSRQEFSYSLTPTYLLHLLRRGYRHVLFIKQESMVTGDLSRVIADLAGASMVLTPHLLRPILGKDGVNRELNILLSGIYNGGFIGVSDTPETIAFLEWWEDRLRFHCVHAIGEGMHFEQRWLDFAPAFVRRLCVSRDTGLNVGHWNLPERQIHVSEGSITAEGRPCSLFRFSGFDPDDPQWVTRYSRRLHMQTLGPAAEIFSRYRQLLMEEGYDVSKGWPYAYECFDNGIPIPLVARQIYRTMGAEATRFANPFAAGPATSFFRWLVVPSPAGAISPLWDFIYRSRPDVQRAYPDPAERDRAAFGDWIREWGMREYGISAEVPVL